MGPVLVFWGLYVGMGGRVNTFGLMEGAEYHSFFLIY